jgi:hypothetical protein
MNNALVYIHIFADGSKYFGNAVNPARPFTQGNRGKKYQKAVETNGNPVVQVRRNLTVEEADTLERWLFDRYIANGGVSIQTRPKGDLARFTAKKSSETRLKMSKAQKNKPKGGAIKGSKRSEETKIKISKGGKGNKNGAGNKGKRHTEETRKKLSGPRVNDGNGKKIISTLDGQITTRQSKHWHEKKNPDYIGTWVDL